jgi:tRNA (guanine37-N1)-methyltransferase
MDLKERLSDRLTEKQLESLKKSFDIIGDVAVIEIPRELKSREREIAKAIAEMHKHVKTVCLKGGEREGELRLRKLRCILGKHTETVHREHGCRFRLDVKKVFFSPRESTERQRIASFVKKGETVLVMFSGVSPYAIIIAKKQDCEVYAIELNEWGHKYALENVRLNCVAARVTPIRGDVKKAVRKFYGKCDRVVMPLPREGHRFLGDAMRCIKPSGGTVHFYYAGTFEEAGKVIKDCANKLKRKVRILRKTKVLPYAPHVWKICIDFRVV